MSRQDDVEPIRVDGPATYPHEAAGPVTGFRVHDDDGLIGVLWYADDPAQDAGGFEYSLHSGRTANAAVHWFRLLREAKAQRLPVRDAVEGLAEHAEPGPWGAVRRDAEHWPSLEALRAEVHESDGPATRPSAAPRTASAPRPSRAEIDDALRRSSVDDDLPPDVAAEVVLLDGALALHPVSEPTAVLIATTWADLGLRPPFDDGPPTPQPAYLLVRFATADAESDLLAQGPEVLARLRVPAGVPALYTPTRPAAAREVPRLLLARGLGLRVTRTVQGAETTYLFGELLQPQPPVGTV